MGDAGVTVNAEKDGVNDLDHKIRPPDYQFSGLIPRSVYILWCDIDT